MSVAAPVTLEQILAQGQNLPSVPRVVTELLATFKREDCDADDIAKLISADTTLSAKVLRLANSAFYRRARSITSVRQATVTVGYVALRLMVASVGVADGIRFPANVDRKRYWRTCLHAAVVARELAKKCGADGEAAFSAGLLHAVGYPAMLMALPHQAAQLEKTAPFFARERAQKEREAWGFDYAQVGGRLAEGWAFPATLVEAIRWSAEPFAAPEFPVLAAVVRTACEMVASRELGLSKDQAMAAIVDPRLLDKLKLTPDQLASVPPPEELAAGLESLFG